MDEPLPHTVESLATDLGRLGVVEGDVLMLHSSRRSIGYVVGGIQAVVEAFRSALGPDGTLVVPAHTSENSDPAGWQRPPVPEAWWPIIRSRSPGFDPLRTPTWYMGAIAETVRTWPGAMRSTHPQVSFAALGARAADVVAEHDLADGLGERSPLGAVYRLGGKVMLLGCGYDSNTSLHLAECRQASPPRSAAGGAVRLADGSSEWVTWTEVDTDEDDFPDVGAAFEATGAVAEGPVGNAATKLMPQPELVDFATTWFAEHRR